MVTKKRATRAVVKRGYPWLPLPEIQKLEPEMERLGVSEVARSRRGFLTRYKAVGGDWRKLDPWWVRRRDGFVARHMAQYRVDRGYRRYLALVAWAYRPMIEPRKLRRQ